MAEPFMGEIMMAGFNFAPENYAMCNGQILEVSQYTTLFSLVGRQFGGNGTTTFQIPDMRGRAPRQIGNDPAVDTGAQTGLETVALTAQNIGHTHQMYGSSKEGTIHVPFDPSSGKGNYPGQVGSDPLATPAPVYAPADSGYTAAIATTFFEPIGSGYPHNNMQPYLVITFCIAMTGAYPQKN